MRIRFATPWSCRAVILLAAFILVGNFVYLEEKDFVCLECNSTSIVKQWRVGFWPDHSLPLTPKWPYVGASVIQADFLPPTHAHRWGFMFESPRRWFGIAGGDCGVGSARPGYLANQYEQQPDFRRFITGTCLAFPACDSR